MHVLEYFVLRNMTLALMLNHEVSIKATGYISSTKTISLIQVVYVRQGSILSLAILNPNGEFVLEENTSWNVVLLGKFFVLASAYALY